MRIPFAARWIVTALLMVGLGSVSCTRPARPLRVGANVWAGYSPLFLAHHLGQFGPAKIQTLSFPNATEVMRAYRHGALEVAAVTADEALTLAQHDSEQRIILVCDFSNGADMIVARPPIRRIADLRGRAIGVEATALGAFLLARALESGGLHSTDVSLKARPMDSQLSAYASGEIDAAVVYEPEASRLLAAGAVRIFDSRQIPGEIIDVLVTRQSTLDAHPGALRQLIAGWFAGLDYLRARPADAGRVLQVQMHLPPDTFPAAFATIELVDRGANQRLLQPGPAGMAGSLRRLQAVMIEHKLLSRAFPVEPLLEGRFVAASEPGSRGL